MVSNGGGNIDPHLYRVAAIFGSTFFRKVAINPHLYRVAALVSLQTKVSAAFPPHLYRVAATSGKEV